jgi:hypothetical protein
MGSTDFVVVTRTPPLVELFKITFQRVKLVTRCITAQLVVTGYQRLTLPSIVSF